MIDKLQVEITEGQDVMIYTEERDEYRVMFKNSKGKQVFDMTQKEFLTSVRDLIGMSYDERCLSRLVDQLIPYLEKIYEAK